MVAAQQQAEADPTRPEDGPAGGRFDGIRQDHLTYEYYEEVGEAAYARAQELERLHGSDDPQAMQAYVEAASNLVAVTWMAPNERVMNDPIRMLRVSDSYAKLVQADQVPAYREPQLDDKGDLIDRRDNLRRISSELLVEAGRLLMGGVGQEEDGVDTVGPAEVISAAVAEAAEEAGGTEEGNVIVLRPDRVARTAEYAIEQLTTGSHEIPPTTEQLELFAGGQPQRVAA